nr:PREDICTED: transmembrane and coiled-coil domain-containing protein 6 [Lepisosteus oculatus]
MWRLNVVRHKLRPQGTNLEELKISRREHEKALRQARRDQQLVSKRRLQEADEDDFVETAEGLLTKEQIMQLFQGIKHSSEERVNHLRTLRRALRCKKTQLTFVKLENSMHVLVGLLSGSNAVHQLEAAYCLHELSHSDEATVPLACLPATPYLLTFLAGQSPKLTELCLYTLGNLSAESEDIRKKLLAQGIIPALASCIQCPHVAVTEAVGYALSQLLQAKEAPEKIIPLVLQSGVTQDLLSALQSNPECGIGTAVECAWCLHYLISSNVNVDLLVAQGAIFKSSSLLVTLGGAVASEFSEEGIEQLISPLLRCLGNLLAGTGGEACREQIRDSRLLVALCAFIQAFLQTRTYIARESLWVMNNLTAEDAIFCSVLLYLNLVPVLIELLPFSKGINIMALRVLCNTAKKGPEYCQQLHQKGVLSALHTTLRMADPEIIHLSLELLHMIVAGSSQVACELVKQEGISLLEAIQYNSQEELRIRATFILDRYLSPQVLANTPVE